MRQWKWWWAFFIWGVGVAAVNAFKMYESMYEEEKEKRGEQRSTPGVGMPKKWTHLEFMVELVYDFIFPRPGRTCVGTLKDGYVRNVPLPRVPQRQSAKQIAPKTGIPIPGYLYVPSWIPTLPKLGSILGFSQRVLDLFPQ